MAKQTIMIVDDEQALRLMLQTLLTAHGYDTAMAGDGDTAIETIKEIMPDLVLLDLGFTVRGGDGFSILRRLKADDTLASIPVVVLTAQEQQGLERLTLDAGAVAFLQKPASSDSLVGAIQKAIGTSAKTVGPKMNEAPPIPESGRGHTADTDDPFF